MAAAAAAINGKFAQNTQAAKTKICQSGQTKIDCRATFFCDNSGVAIRANWHSSHSSLAPHPSTHLYGTQIFRQPVDSPRSPPLWRCGGGCGKVIPHRPHRHHYWGGLNYSITENSITRRRPVVLVRPGVLLGPACEWSSVLVNFESRCYF